MRYNSCYDTSVPIQHLWWPQIRTMQYQTKVSLHQQVVTHLNSTQIGKISEAVWDWLNTKWPYIPRVSMYAITSVTIHITPTVIVTMMPYQYLVWSSVTCPSGKPSLRLLYQALRWMNSYLTSTEAALLQMLICGTAITHTDYWWVVESGLYTA